MSTLTKAPAATASMASQHRDDGHWYQQIPDGTSPTGSTWHPLYSPTKNYTLREARKDREAGRVVVPSVTTVFKCLHKRQLVDYLMGQVAMACYRAGREPGVPRTLIQPEAQYVEEMVNIANGASRGAMDLGTRIHGALELAVATGGGYDATLDSYVTATLAEREKLGVKKIAIEVACGSAKYGYGGKCDESAEGMTILDYKSRKSNKNKTPKVASYSTDEMQVAAYGYAIHGNAFFKGGRGIILGISTTHPGLVTPHVFTGPELVPAFEAFLGLLQVWRYENTFDPRITLTGDNPAARQEWIAKNSRASRISV